jgi:hypothetical protein
MPPKICTSGGPFCFYRRSMKLHGKKEKGKKDDGKGKGAKLFGKKK